MNIPMETREKWINAINKTFNEDSNAIQSIRPWDILLYLDGFVTAVQVPIPETTLDETLSYPVRFQMPSTALEKFPKGEHPLRSETFALGCLMYEIHALNKPYADLEDDLVYQKYIKGEFPTKDDSTFFERLRDYARQNPTAFGFQAAGLALGAISMIAVPFLGVIGFTAIGPAAGSVAAGWQASLGIVHAGSLFAWCQVG